MPKNADPLFPVPWQWLKKYPYNWPAAAAEEEKDGGIAAFLELARQIWVNTPLSRTLYKEIVFEKVKAYENQKYGTFCYSLTKHEFFLIFML